MDELLELEYEPRCIPLELLLLELLLELSAVAQGCAGEPSNSGLLELEYEPRCRLLELLLELELRLEVEDAP